MSPPLLIESIDAEERQDAPTGFILPNGVRSKRLSEGFEREFCISHDALTRERDARTDFLDPPKFRALDLRCGANEK